LVHDYLLVMRGAERTFATMAECWPDSDIHALLYDSDGTRGAFADRWVQTSYLQRLNLCQSTFRRALPLFPRAAESLRVCDADVVVSSSSAFAHGIRPRADATHICYCHSPFRYVWHERARALSEAPPLLRPYLGRTLDHIRDWDLRASARVTQYIANSEATRIRIGEFYGRDSVVIHPPVETERFSTGEHEDFLLMVTETVRHKRIDVALEAARRAGKVIKVVGTGPDLEALRQRFGGCAEFLGRVSDAELAGLYARAAAFVMANVEEFGIAAVEAQAAGRPVVAVAAGGALETVVDGETGVLVPEGDIAAMAEALRFVDFDRFSPVAIQKNAERFSVSTFKERLTTEVARITGTTALAFP
jgi:glycosyltransferase involved in cell wall biosynthesis